MTELHAGFDRHTVADLPVDGDRPVDLAEHFRRGRRAGKDTLFARDEHRDGGLVFVDAADRRDVAEHTHVLGERFFDEAAQDRDRRIERSTHGFTSPGRTPEAGRTAAHARPGARNAPRTRRSSADSRSVCARHATLHARRRPQRCRATRGGR